MNDAGDEGGWLRLGTDNWQADLLRIVQRVTVVLGGLVCIPSVWLALEAGAVGVAVVDVVGLAGLITLTAATRWPFSLRSIGTCVVFFAIGVGLLIGVGPISQIYLFAFSMFATLLLGLRAGLVTVVVNAITFGIVGAVGLTNGTMRGPAWGSDLSGWIVVTGNFLMLNVCLVVALGAVLTRLQRSL
ncbi:MAG TPA: hypothetical protein VGF99_12750, partial [Myxococcota bacterium]